MEYIIDMYICIYLSCYKNNNKNILCTCKKKKKKKKRKSNKNKEKIGEKRIKNK